MLLVKNTWKNKDRYKEGEKELGHNKSKVFSKKELERKREIVWKNLTKKGTETCTKKREEQE